MRKEEERLIDCLVKGMLKTHFSSKQEMAQALGVSEEQLDTRGSYELLNQMLHYCVSNLLPMEPLINDLVD